MIPKPNWVIVSPVIASVITSGLKLLDDIVIQAYITRRPRPMALGLVASRKVNSHLEACDYIPLDVLDGPKLIKLGQYIPTNVQLSFSSLFVFETTEDQYDGHMMPFYALLDMLLECLYVKMHVSIEHKFDPCTANFTLTCGESYIAEGKLDFSILNHKDWIEISSN